MFHASCARVVVTYLSQSTTVKDKTKTKIYTRKKHLKLNLKILKNTGFNCQVVTEL